MEKTQERLEFSPSFTGVIIIKGEIGLEDLLRMVRNFWKSGYPVVMRAKEIRFKKE